MKTLIGHTTSLQYWRTHALDETEACRVTSLADAVCTLRDLDTISLYALGLKAAQINLIIPRERRRRSTDRIRYRIWSGDLPAGAVRRVRGDIYVESPEMCFLEYAACHSITETVLYGLEICGSYALSVDDGPARYEIEPLTRTSRIASFLRRCPNHRGAKTARRALRYVRNGSESPMESAVYMLLSMPRTYGGYRLPAPQLNGKIEFGAKERFLGQKGDNRCDLLWRKRHLALEYNSNLVHDNAQSITSDSMRANVLGHHGIQVVSLTWNMVANAAEFAKIVQILVWHLRIKQRPRISRSRFQTYRNMLRATVLPPIRRY